MQHSHDNKKIKVATDKKGDFNGICKLTLSATTV